MCLRLVCVRGWPLHDIAITNIVCCMAKQGGRRETVYYAISIATHNGEGLQHKRC